MVDFTGGWVDKREGFSVPEPPDVRFDPAFEIPRPMPPPPPPPHKFKVGDLVHSANDYSNQRVKAGDNGVVVKLGGAFVVDVKFDDGRIHSYHENNLSAGKSVPSRFKVNDGVFYISGRHGVGSGNPEGVLGTVTRVRRSGGGWTIHVRWCNGHSNTYSEIDLTHASKEQKEKIEKERLSRVVKVTERMHNLFSDALAHIEDEERGDEGEIYPICYLIGKNRKGIIAGARRLTGIGGCGYMITIDARDVAKRMAELYRYGYTPCGIARMGIPDLNSQDPTPHEMSKWSGGAETFIINFNRTIGIQVQSCIYDHRAGHSKFTRYEYAIVKTSR
jgi:hypothetical protein